jgi:hypothetical protein
MNNRHNNIYFSLRRKKNEGKEENEEHKAEIESFLFLLSG